MTTELEWMKPDQHAEVARLIYESTNAWYRKHRGFDIFEGGSTSVEYFCELYEAVDPGGCLLAIEAGDILGSCFVHQRPTHFSLGIMNVASTNFGKGVARRLLTHIQGLAERAGKPLRLVSSAMNLDSFSLYSRAGFRPFQIYQDVQLSVPSEGLAVPVMVDSSVTLIDGRTEHAVAMVDLEAELMGIRRPVDLKFFLEPSNDEWSVTVGLDKAGDLVGWCASICHPACRMIGPLAARSTSIAAGLMHRELQRHRDETLIALVPSQQVDLVQQCYSWGGKNCELHFHQCWGEYQPIRGICMPTFLPETA